MSDKATALQSKVAEAKGLQPELAARLAGETEDELAADADELLASLKPESGSTFMNRAIRTRRKRT
jgi:hypothetical protein